MNFDLFQMAREDFSNQIINLPCNLPIREKKKTLQALLNVVTS